MLNIVSVINSFSTVPRITWKYWKSLSGSYAVVASSLPPICSRHSEWKCQHIPAAPQELLQSWCWSQFSKMMQVPSSDISLESHKPWESLASRCSWWVYVLSKWSVLGMDEQESHNLANGQDPETREPEEFASSICFQWVCLTLNLSTLHIVKFKKCIK